MKTKNKKSTGVIYGRLLEPKNEDLFVKTLLIASRCMKKKEDKFTKGKIEDT